MPARKNTNRIVNVIPSADTQEDWRIDNAQDAGLLGAPVALPPSVDLRAAWWKIGDQGSTGSCVGWGTAEGVLRWHFVKAARITQTEILSPRFVWMAAKETDEFINRPTDDFHRKRRHELKVGVGHRQKVRRGQRYDFAVQFGKTLSGRREHFLRDCRPA